MKKTLIIIALVLLSSLAAFPAGRDPQHGYRGFAEVECVIMPDLGFLVGSGGDSDVGLGLSTVHGYQFNPHLFVGGGIGFMLELSSMDHKLDFPQLVYLPLFVDVRTDLRFRRFTPFADLRLGWNLVEKGFLSGALTLGYRFNWGRKVALNLALGVNLRGERYEGYDSGWNEVKGPWSRPNGQTLIGWDAKPLIRLGVEF